MKKNYWLLITGLILLILDQLTKYLFINKHYNFGFFAINYVQNTGISFGLLQGTSNIMIAVSLIVIFLLIFYKKEFKGYEIFHTFLIVGTLGNLIDRIFRGYVIDFFDLKWWPVFNVADSLLFIGVFGIIISFLLQNYFIKQNQKSSKS